MGLFDMSINDLMEYTGENPCPSDHDNYWERAISEMKLINPNIEMIERKFNIPTVECFDLYFTGVKGARIHAKYARPKNAENCRAIAHFHGYSASSGEWSDKIAYAALGFSIMSMDCRGQGGTSEDVGGVIGNTLNGHLIRGLDGEKDNMLMRHVFLDTAQMAGILMDMSEVDNTKVAAMGGSQGGGLTLACSALEPRINRLIPEYPFLSDYYRVWKMDLAVAAYKEITEHFRRFDPTHERELEIFTKLGYIDIQFLAKRIKGEVLMATGLMDQICPPSSQFATYNKINSKKNVVFYHDFGHEHLNGFEDKKLEFLLEM